MIKFLVTWILVILVCLCSSTGIVGDFDIRIEMEENSLIIASNLQLGAPDLTRVVDGVLLAKLGNREYRANSHRVEEITISKCDTFEFDCDGDEHVKTTYLSRKRLELHDFFDAPLVIKSNISPSEWAIIIKKEYEKN